MMLTQQILVINAYAFIQEKLKKRDDYSVIENETI